MCIFPLHLAAAIRSIKGAPSLRFVVHLVAQAIRNAIRANRFARVIRNSNPYFHSASGRFARIARISDSRESPDSRELCESTRPNHATKVVHVCVSCWHRGFSGMSKPMVCLGQPGGFHKNAGNHANEDDCQLSKKILWIFSSNLPGNFALKSGGDFW